MPSIMAIATAAIAGVFGVLVFAEVYAAINKANISTASQNLLALVPLLLAAAIVVAIVYVFR